MGIFNQCVDKPTHALIGSESNNGVLDRKGLRKVVKSLGVAATQQELDAVVWDIDADGNAQISPHEFSGRLKLHKKDTFAQGEVVAGFSAQKLEGGNARPAAAAAVNDRPPPTTGGEYAVDSQNTFDQQVGEAQRLLRDLDVSMALYDSTPLASASTRNAGSPVSTCSSSSSSSPSGPRSVALLHGSFPGEIYHPSFAGHGREAHTCTPRQVMPEQRAGSMQLSLLRQKLKSLSYGAGSTFQVNFTR